MAEAPFLVARNLSKAFHDQALFTDISFSLHPGDKVALIARNGAGKTTLIRALAGLEALDQGELEFNRQIRIGYVFQNPELNPEHSIKEAVMDSELPALKALKHYELALARDNPEDLEQAFADMDQHHAWDLHQELQRMLSVLKLDHLHQPVSQLSGGQQRRIALARALLEQPDLLILDEPTNHLDLDMIEWLENYLSRSRQTLLMVTHDRYFLESVCNRILELEQQKLFEYPGNFSIYLENKAARAESNAREREADLNMYRKELAWVRKQPRARGTKSKSRVEAFDNLDDKLAAGQDDKSLQMDIQMQRLGKKILEIEHLSKAFGSQVLFNDFSHTFSRGNRIGIIGRNGTGKSTFLNIISGLEAADSGDFVWGETVKTAYYRQQGMALDDKMRVIEVVRDVAEFLPLKKGKILTAAQLLERFLFNAAAQYRQIGTLSGGEKRRLYLLTLLMQNPNFLILDEPTNDLDIQTIQILEDFLLEYPGCLLIVSHDRYLMDKIVDHLFIFKGDGELIFYPGTYSRYWQEEQEALKEKNKPVAKPPEKKAPKTQAKKLTWNEEREFEGLEAKIEQLQTHKAALEKTLANSAQLDAGELTRRSKEYGQSQEDLESAEIRWLELAEKKEAMQQ